MASFYLNYLAKHLPPNTITFSGTGVSTSTSILGGHTSTQKQGAGAEGSLMGSCSRGRMLSPGPVLLPVGPPSEVHSGAADAECPLADTTLQWGLAPFLLRRTQGSSPQNGDPTPCTRCLSLQPWSSYWPMGLLVMTSSLAWSH